MLSQLPAGAEHYCGKHICIWANTKETEWFVRTFDRFFDLFNVRSLTEGVHKRKPDLCPYRNNQQSMDHLKASACAGSLNMKY